MIPQRRLTRSGFGNGVSCRVEACRRRLRTVRASEAPVRLEERPMKSAAESGGLNVAANTATFDNIGIQGQDEAEIT
jgi:hypothetical protein